MQTTELKDLVKMYTSSQNFRTRAQNRVAAKLKGGNEEFESRDYETETQFNRRVNKMVKEHIEALETKLSESYNEEISKKNSLEPKKVTKITMEEVKKMLDFIEQEKYRMETESFGHNVFSLTTANLVKKYKKIESEIAAKCAIVAETEHPDIYRWLTSLDGIGPVFASALIAYVGDISRFNHVSSLWQYAGMGMVTRCENCGKRVFPNGGAGKYIENMTKRRMEINAMSKDKSKVKSQEEIEDLVKSSICTCGNCRPKNVVQKQVAGELADFNPDFKKLCFLISDQFVKQTGSFYNLLYKQYYNDYLYRPDLQAEASGKKGKKTIVKGQVTETKGTAHINAMARRKAVKMFLSHLWEEWRTVEGLPTPNPWVLEHGHVDKVERPRIEYK